MGGGHELNLFSFKAYAWSSALANMPSVLPTHLWRVPCPSAPGGHSEGKDRPRWSRCLGTDSGVKAWPLLGYVTRFTPLNLVFFLCKMRVLLMPAF